MSIKSVVELIIGAVILYLGINNFPSTGADIFDWIFILVGAATIGSAIFPKVFNMSSDGDSSFDGSDSGGDGD